MKGVLKRVGLILMVLLLLLNAVGCAPTKGDLETTAPVTTEAKDNGPSAVYDAAVEALTGDTLGLDIECERTVTVAGVSYRESSELELEYWGRNSEDLLIKADQEITYGDEDYELDITELYHDGKVYQEIHGSKFWGEQTVQEFEERYVPVKMLDPSLYTVEADSSGKKLTFTQATAGESWLVPEDAQLHSASGTANLDDAGKLKSADYTVQYTHGTAEYTVSYRLTVTDVGRQEDIPADTSAYVLLDYIDAAYALEHAYGYACQAEHLSFDTHDLVVSAAAACAIQTNVTADTYTLGSDYAAMMENNISATNYSTGEAQEYKLTEKFVDGKYTRSIDDGEESTDSSVNETAFRTGVTQYLTQWIMDMDYVASVEATHLGSLLLLEFTGTEQMGKDLCGDICQTLFGNATTLDAMASDYRTDKAEFYLALDAYSMLPTAVGVQYEGAHTIEGQELILSRQVGQSMDLATLNSHDAIFEKPAPEEQPQEPATPLFYRVTGENGQEMWLFGTIHVGDDRTGFLPDEIYEALYASDAIAVECDTEAFSQQIEEDEALMQQVSDCYFYSDGSMTKDHIETPDLYESAIQVLKATGSYYYNTEYEMPHVWSSYIDNYYVSQGHKLTSEKGVEERLLALAEEKNIPVYEVESSLFQLQMMGNYSDHLQEVLLYTSVAFDGKSAWESTMELYELWCAGDEAALTQEIAGESWEFTEEDFNTEDLTGEDLERVQAILADLDNINAQLIQLQEEYDKAMSFDRNEGMLEVAKGYLESGETVFYAVGLAHLLAENGLVGALRDAGYTVELVTYS